MDKKRKNDDKRHISAPSPFRTPLYQRFFDDELWPESFSPLRARINRNIFPSRVGFPKVDVSETAKDVKIVADIPGIDPDNLDIDVKSDRIALHGTIEHETEDDEQPYRYERAFGEFRRELTLPTEVKEDEAKAKYKDGVLTVTLPKAKQENKKKKIKIAKE